MLNIIERGISAVEQDRCEAVPKVVDAKVIGDVGCFLDSSECFLRMSDRSTGCISGKDIGVLRLLKSSLIMDDFLS